jgi:hypothetical protein
MTEYTNIGDDPEDPWDLGESWGPTFSKMVCWYLGIKDLSGIAGEGDPEFEAYWKECCEKDEELDEDEIDEIPGEVDVLMEFEIKPTYKNKKLIEDQCMAGYVSLCTFRGRPVVITEDASPMQIYFAKRDG